MATQHYQEAMAQSLFFGAWAYASNTLIMTKTFDTQREETPKELSWGNWCQNRGGAYADSFIKLMIICFNAIFFGMTLGYMIQGSPLTSGVNPTQDLNVSRSIVMVTLFSASILSLCFNMYAKAMNVDHDGNNGKAWATVFATIGTLGWLLAQSCVFFIVFSHRMYTTQPPMSQSNWISCFAQVTVLIPILIQIVLSMNEKDLEKKIVTLFCSTTTHESETHSGELYGRSGTQGRAVKVKLSGLQITALNLMSMSFAFEYFTSYGQVWVFFILTVVYPVMATFWTRSTNFWLEHFILGYLFVGQAFFLFDAFQYPYQNLTMNPSVMAPIRHQYFMQDFADTRMLWTAGGILDTSLVFSSFALIFGFFSLLEKYKPIWSLITGSANPLMEAAQVALGTKPVS
jgi:hypothetical protein